MERHHEKRRDMARSILPSTNRKPARNAITRTKRAHRRAIRHDLSVLGRPHLAATPIGIDDPSGDGWDERVDLRRYPSAEIRDTVRWRRGGDKLNHFIRWAIASTAGLPVDDRLSHLRSIVGSRLIGDHAMSHLERERALRPPHAHLWCHWCRHQIEIEERGAREEAELEVLRALLLEIAGEAGGLAGLNRHMKTCDVHRYHDRCLETACVKRCLAGAHDIDRFLVDVDRSGWDRWRVIVPAADWDRWRLDGPERLPGRRFHTYLKGLRDAAAPDHNRTEEVDR